MSRLVIDLHKTNEQQPFGGNSDTTMVFYVGTDPVFTMDTVAEEMISDDETGVLEDAGFDDVDALERAVQV